MAKVYGRWMLKGCPSCGGDLYVDKDDPGYLKCLQCCRSFRSGSPQERSSVRDEPRRGRKARLPG
ncbi:MAG: hypothetical protein HYY32_05765 [Chloroflexi bacterium]|nr:hypothetical protein [Chloroflexota bacterium]